MRPVLSRSQMRAFDQEWMRRGVPGIVLMENAGRGAAHLIGLKVRPRAPHEAPRQGSSVVGSCIRCADERALSGANVLVLAGIGNNGGDGFVVARHLASRAANVRVVLVAPAEKLRGDARLAHDALTALGVPCEALPKEDAWSAMFGEADVVVDALLGTGIDRPVEGTLATLITALNATGLPVIALDVPSGLDAETGAPLGPVVRATHTVTFAHLKKGLLTTEGHRSAGNITISHIGVPNELRPLEEPAAWLLEESDVRAQLERRSPVAHKGSAGRVVVIAGSPGTVGAARLSARATLRAGAGTVTVLTSPQTARHLQDDATEIMTRAWSFSDGGGDASETTSADAPSAEDATLLTGAHAIVVGPGLGQGPPARAALQAALAARGPIALDADALRLLAARPSRDLRPSSGDCLCVLTPHPGEAAALLGISIADVEADRFAASQRLAEETGAVVILKGSRTIVAAPGRRPVVSAFGSPALGTAGSGDVLSGILGALLAFSESAEEAFQRAVLAVALHGMAGERWAAEHGDRGLLASEIADQVPHVIARLLSEK